MKFTQPMRCLLCHAPTKNYALCTGCFNDLPHLQHACQQCAMPIAKTATVCAHCIQHPFAFDETISLFHYQFPIDRMLLDLKFHHQLQYAKLFGQLLAEKLKNINVDFILPVPLHRTRLKERTFNQALEIARPVAKKLQLSIDIKRCIRQKATAPQSETDHDKRKSNVYRAFKVVKKMKANHILILDDILTTGHTANELAKTLKQSGVKKITLATIARTDKCRSAF